MGLLMRERLRLCYFGVCIGWRRRHSHLEKCNSTLRSSRSMEPSPRSNHVSPPGGDHETEAATLDNPALRKTAISRGARWCQATKLKSQSMIIFPKLQGAGCGASQQGRGGRGRQVPRCCSRLPAMRETHQSITRSKKSPIRVSNRSAQHIQSVAQALQPEARQYEFQAASCAP